MHVAFEFRQPINSTLSFSFNFYTQIYTKNLPFFFLLGPFVLTNVVTCKTSGSNVFSTDIVRISKFFGSHFNAICPKSPNVPIVQAARIYQQLQKCTFTQNLGKQKCLFDAFFSHN